MKLLFKGTWKKERDLVDEGVVLDYFKALAHHLVRSNHVLVLSSTRRHHMLLAEEVSKAAALSGRDVKEILTFMLPDRESKIPQMGRVQRYSGAQWKIGDRTYLVQQTDAVIAIGGGKGTSDSIQKAFLARKPVFAACAVSSVISDAWRRRPDGAEYHYVEKGDADFVEDVNTTPDVFFQNVFAVLGKIASTRYPYRVFLVHGRRHDVRDELMQVVEKLGFDVIVLAKQPNQSLTVIEKLERDIERVGFAFIIYTPDDIGGLQGSDQRPRARQNVIFEHGLLSGKMGRDRTCAIVVGSDIEFPSDIFGMLYEEFDSFDGKDLNHIKRIVDILKAAGYEVDLSPFLQ